MTPVSPDSSDYEPVSPTPGHGGNNNIPDEDERQLENRFIDETIELEDYPPQPHEGDLSAWCTDASKAAASALNVRFKAQSVSRDVHLDLDTLAWSPRSYKPVPELSGKVLCAHASTELEKRVQEVTGIIMARNWCNICQDYQEKDQKLYVTCEQHLPVQHLVCESCFDKDKTSVCPMCRGERPRQRTEQCEAMRRDFYRIKLQSCPLCTDPEKRTADELLKHVHTECAAIKSETVTVDVRRLRAELAAQRSRCVQELCDSPVTVDVMRKAFAEVLAKTVAEWSSLQMPHAREMRRLKRDVDQLDTYSQLSDRDLKDCTKECETLKSLVRYHQETNRCLQLDYDHVRRQFREQRENCDRLQREVDDLRRQRRVGSHAEAWGRPKRSRQWHEMHRVCWHDFASMHCAQDPRCPVCRQFPAHRTIVRYPPHDEASNLTDTLVHAADGMPTSETDRERLAARDASDRRNRECRLYRERITLAVHVERAARARQDCAEREASERETHRKRVSLEMNPANKRARLTELTATRAMLHERYLRSMTGLDVLAECACLQ
ncbi:hypothetical protein CYMTET_38641 [Cymbomonas tetramitiformis]|uniref:RING-type domain-containing protein n=1 Tax=Cymbomonas tetramitiformis TaxID=36881 RepID=A0AAE0F537_9CHLO|nr:hypothetical protein CYMTET_38641 [Cymbomonas tetramitiformis]